MIRAIPNNAFNGPFDDPCDPSGPGACRCDDGLALIDIRVEVTSIEPGYECVLLAEARAWTAAMKQTIEAWLQFQESIAPFLPWQEDEEV